MSLSVGCGGEVLEKWGRSRSSREQDTGRESMLVAMKETGHSCEGEMPMWDEQDSGAQSREIRSIRT